MSFSTRPIGLPYPEPSLATWWPELDITDAGTTGFYVERRLIAKYSPLT
jgi:hypothetical protein